jgi:1-acyl-sn-glycerol-3-phosphate acyltransferase
MIRRRLARAVFRLTGWTHVGDLPRTGIFVGAPHTSNWDFVITLMVMWHDGLSPRILVKKELFNGPLGYLLRFAGSVPVDRHNPGGVVNELVAQARSGEPFVLVLAAEGSRSKAEYWKSGFYRLSQQTGLPILMGFVDRATKTAGIGPSLTPSGNVKADMDLIREFYADKNGLYPRYKTEPRLREEDAAGD